VHFTVNRNGRTVAGPSRLALVADGKRIDVSIERDEFAVPSGLVQSQDVDLFLEIAGEVIKIPALTGAKFKANDWTLFLADRQYDYGYQQEFGGDTDVSKTCILKFDGPNVQATNCVVEQCRTRKAN
jgi:hypothetical protein